MLSLAYPSDLENAYAFYCSRYTDISWREFLNLGIEEFSMKLSSIPESEPLYKIIKSRVISLSKIKDKEEKKYWRDLRKANKIPDEYLPYEENDENLKDIISQIGGILK